MGIFSAITSFLKAPAPKIKKRGFVDVGIRSQNVARKFWDYRWTGLFPIGKALEEAQYVLWRHSRGELVYEEAAERMAELFLSTGEIYTQLVVDRQRVSINVFPEAHMPFAIELAPSRNNMWSIDIQGLFPAESETTFMS